MRRLVEPSASARCVHCNGELLLKRVEPDAMTFDVVRYLCAKCGSEQSRRIAHDPYTAPASRRA